MPPLLQNDEGQELTVWELGLLPGYNTLGPTTLGPGGSEILNVCPESNPSWKPEAPAKIALHVNPHSLSQGNHGGSYGMHGMQRLVSEPNQEKVLVQNVVN